MGSGIQTIRLMLSEEGSEELLVTSLAADVYRMEEGSILEEIDYHDVIRTSTDSSGVIRFVQVIEKSGLKRLTCMLSDDVCKDPRLQNLLDRIIRAGGHWEKTFRGVLTLYIPNAEVSSVAQTLAAIPRKLKLEDGLP